MFITVYNDSRCKPIGGSVELDVDPSRWLGEPDCKAGSIISWSVGPIVIVLSTGELTTPTS